MITRAWRSGDRAATFADLQAIATALEAYRQDHGDYPRVRRDTAIAARAYTAIEPRPNPPSGAQILCQALIGPAPAADNNVSANQRAIQDGAEGPGFRIRPGAQGKVYGPYLPVGRFRVADPATPNTPLDPRTKGLLATILDRYGKPILYFPASLTKPKVEATSGEPFVGQQNPASELSLYDAEDNYLAFDPGRANAARKIRLMLGDTNANGRIDPGEKPAHTGPFILWSTGPDERFGPAGDEAEPRGPTPDAKDAERVDDVTNYRQ
jgi:hypothetical protein